MRISKQSLFITIGIIAALLVGLSFYIKRRRDDKEVLLAAIHEAIEKDRGLDGTLDYMSELARAKPDLKYYPAADAEKLWSAQGKNIWTADKPEPVFEVLRGKTRGQLIVLSDELKRTYGKDLKAFIEFLFDMPYERESRSRAEEMIKAAP